VAVGGFVRVLARFIASGFGSGYAPAAAGTFGSLAGVAIGGVILATRPALLPVAVVLAAIVGFWAIHKVRATDDPGWVVIDEIAGQLIALLPLARAAPWGIVLGFVLFRLFDITKLGPIGWLDRRHDAAGVMGDDLAAGAVAALGVWAASLAAPWLTH
jgi:phosphatidylglycerophosphatase A